MNTLRNLLMLTAMVVATSAQGQKEQITPKLNHVTVFTNGAQVERSHSMNIMAGEQVVTFTGISPYADTKSMQVKAKGRLTVLGINFRTTHPDSLQRVQQLKKAEQQAKLVADRQQELRSQREVIEAQLEMVKTNCSVAGRTAVTPLAGIKELNSYYSQELLALKKKTHAVDEELAALEETYRQRMKTVDSIAHLRLKTVTEVEVKLSAPQAGRAEFLLSYYVKNAGWYATYDIRSEGISRPLQLSYKANVFQNVKEDWNNVAVTLSSANPSRSNIAPELRTYWLNYGKSAPRYDEETREGSVSGRVVDEQGSPIVGASVRVMGTQLGTVTDLNGNYSIALPRGKVQLQFAYIGFVTQTRLATSSTLNIVMREDEQALQEVVVVGYGTKNAKRSAKQKVAKNESADAMAVREAPMEAKSMVDPLPESELISVDEQKAQFGYEFEIRQPMTLPSNGKTTVTEIGRYDLPADYHYRGIPRADKDAFLLADATGWQQLSLLEGEANVYFENAFVGKSILNPTEPSDTLHFSLGRDNSIRIRRTKVAEHSTRRMLSSAQEQTLTWRITVKNTRKENVRLTLQDQIPVSQNSAITVTVDELTGGELDSERGIVSWPLQLAAGEERELTVQYRVKYPKNRRLDIE